MIHINDTYKLKINSLKKKSIYIHFMNTSITISSANSSNNESAISNNVSVYYISDFNQFFSSSFILINKIAYTS